MPSRVRHWYDYHDLNNYQWTPQNRKAHSGIDVVAPWGTAYTAPFDGMVSFANCEKWGGQVDVTGFWHGAIYTATGIHLHQILTNTGKRVKRGDILGYSGGDTRGPCPTQMRVKGKPGGYSWGPHVHFELTFGSVGPYHGGPPYNISSKSYTVSPRFLLEELRGNTQEQNPPPESGIAYESQDAFANLFDLPAATVKALDAIPGIENIIYRLHEAETFPGWKSIDRVAPEGNIPDINFPGGSVPLGTIINKLNPARTAYWLVGNLFGNFRASTVRSIYLFIGLIMFIALFIAAADSYLKSSIDNAEETIKTVLPLAEMIA